MSENEKAKELMAKGWRAREDLDFEKAEELLTLARRMFEEQEDWFNVTEAVNHLVYNEKLRAHQHSLKGYSLAKESEEISRKRGLKRASVVRAIMSIDSSLGNFEEALRFSQEALELNKKPIPRADALSHHAMFLLRTGKLGDAEKAIDECLKIVESSQDRAEEPHRSIWKTKALLAKGLVLYNKGEIDEAKRFGEQALKIAIGLALKTRKAEAEVFLQLFD